MKNINISAEIISQTKTETNRAGCGTNTKIGPATTALITEEALIGLIHQYNHISNISLQWNNTTSQWNQSYLNQGAVAIPRRLCIKVIMMVDGCEAADHRLQGSAVLLNLSYTRDQALGNISVRQIRRPTHNRNVVFTYCF